MSDIIIEEANNKPKYVEFKAEDLEITNTFSDGIYCRSGVMPGGTFIVGHKHNNKCVNIMSTGRMKMWMDGEIYDLIAPCIFESAAGSRKVLHIIEDVTFTNVHATETTDLEELRKEIITEEEFIITDEMRGLLCG